MSLQFIDFYNNVRNGIVDPLTFDWILHTTVGPLNTGRFTWQDDTGVICVHGLDAEGISRFFAFTDAQMMSFPLEVRQRAKTINAKTIGFVGNNVDLTDIAENSAEH